MTARIRLIALAVMLAVAAMCAATPTDPLSRFAPTGGYVVEEYGLNCLNHTTKNFDWVLEYLTEASLVANVKREGDFYTDVDLPKVQQVHPGDYTNSGLDRGHGACSRYHRRTLSENASTFSMRNMMAQVPRLNRVELKALEEEIAGFVVDGNTVWVLTAPVWYSDKSKITVETFGDPHVWIPTHCLKAVLIRHLDTTYECKTWLIPNVDDVQAFDTYRCTAAYGQAKSGLDLWAWLPDDVEKQIELTK